jgi:hypothetical protein
MIHQIIKDKVSSILGLTHRTSANPPFFYIELHIPSGHVYVCKGSFYVCKGICICVQGVMYMCVRGHVNVCKGSCICV